MKKKNYNFPVGGVIAIVVSFALAVLDMMFLYKAVQSVFSQTRLMSMVISLGIATVANYSALQWGADNGKNQNNKFTYNSFMWIFIGLFYAAIRTLNIVFNYEELNIAGELFQIVILAIFYIGTGVTIRSSAKNICDADAMRYRKAKKEFEELHRMLAAAEKPIVKEMAALKDFKKHYDSLERQKGEIERGIEKTERATAAAITSLVLKNNPGIDSAATHRVMEESLEKAREKFKAKNEKKGE